MQHLLALTLCDRLLEAAIHLPNNERGFDYQVRWVKRRKSVAYGKINTMRRNTIPVALKGRPRGYYSILYRVFSDSD